MTQACNGAELFNERMTSVRVLIQYVIEDVLDQKSLNNLGWRVVDFKEGIIHFLNQLNCLQRRGDQIRLNITDKYIGDKFPTLKRDFNKLKYYLENREIIYADIKKVNDLERNIDDVIQRYKDDITIINCMICIGVWKMFSFSGIAAPMEKVIESGFSPKEWALSSYKTIKYLTNGLINKKIDDVTLYLAFKKLIEIDLLNSYPELPDLEVEIIERVKYVINWDFIEENIFPQLLSYLGLTWFVVSLADELNLMPSYTDSSIRLTYIIRKFVESILEIKIEDLDEELKGLHDFFNGNQVEWANEMFSLPEVV